MVFGIGEKKSSKGSKKTPKEQPPKGSTATATDEEPAEQTKKSFFTLSSKKDKTAEPAVYKLPLINMLPVALVLANKRRSLIRMFIIFALGLLTAIIIVWFGQAPAITYAQNQVLAAASQKETAIQASNQLKPVSDYYIGLQDRAVFAVDAVSSQLNYSDVVKGIIGAAPPGVTISSVGIVYNETSEVDAAAAAAAAPATGTTGAGVCGQTTLFATDIAPEPPLGCVTFGGTATDSGSMTQYIRALGEIPTLQFVTITPSVGGEDGSVTFTGIGAVASAASVKDMAQAIVALDGLPGISMGGEETPAAETPVDPAATTGATE